MTHSLLHLQTGTTGRLSELGGDGPLTQRLLAMGFLPGQRVQRRQQAPWGGPLIVQASSAIVALRQADASTLRVDACET